MIVEERRTASNPYTSTKESCVSEVSLRKQKRSLPLVLHRSWLRLSRLKLGCFLLLSHCVKQGDEALTCLRCLGMVRPKYLLANCQRTGIPGSGLLAVVLRFPKPREVVHGLSRFEMLRPQHLFADVQRALIEELRLRILVQLQVEIGEAGERLGHLRMVWTQCLFADMQCSLIEHLRLLIPALILIDIGQSVERLGHLRMLWP